MFCSTIIPTIGRPTLARAVNSVLDQKFNHEDFEVIVVNDSGMPLRKEEWQNSARVRVIETERRNRSVARNAGAAVAKGRYLHFLDDDDWILPGAFGEFWDLANRREAAWLYGAFRFVDNSGEEVLEIFPDEEGNCLIQLIAWEWLPLQASLIQSEAFFSVGGFASLESLLGGFEDIDLSRQIALHYNMAKTSKVVTCIRIGDEGSTTNYVNMFMQNRQSREKAINAKGALFRMVDSARNNPSRSDYWHGKIVYYYIASLKWHLRYRQPIVALSRILHAIAGFFAAGRHTLSTQFWQGVMKPHHTRMGTALQESGADRLYNDTRLKLEAFDKT